MAKKKATRKKAAGKGVKRSRPQLPGIEDNLPDGLVAALEEVDKKTKAKARAERDVKKAEAEIFKQLKAEGLQQVKSADGKNVYYLKNEEKLARRKVEPLEKAQAETQQVA